MLLLGVLQAQAAGVVGAGSFDLLETQVLASSAASVTFSSLSTYAADYQHLQIRITARHTVADTIASMNSRINGATSGYSQHGLFGNGSSVSSFGEANTSYGFNFYIPAGNSATNSFGAGVVDILDPFNSSKNTTVRSLGGSSDTRISLGSFAYNSTTAVSSYSLHALSGNFAIGSRFSLYGYGKGA